MFLLQMLCLELANKGQETEKVMNVMAICKAVKSISYNPHIDYYYGKVKQSKTLEEDFQIF